jgi:nitroreductase
VDVFEAVNSRIACRHFLDKPVDLNTVRKLIKDAARAASSSNLQPWNVYAVTGGPLKEIKRQAAETIEQQDWRTLEAEYPEYPRELWEPYQSRSSVSKAQLYGAQGIS